MLLVCAALAMKVIVPAGFMPVASGGVMTVQMCSGTGPATIEIAIPGLPDQHHKQDKAEMPCTFAGLSAPALSAVDPILLAVAIALILHVVGSLAPTPLIAARTYLRPPLRGPPTTV